MKSSLRGFYCLIALSVSAAAAPPSWIERSDRNSALVLEAFGAFDPEWVSQLGVERFDPEVTDLKPGHVQRLDGAAAGLLERLSALRKAESDPLVRQDLDILVDALERGRRTRALEERLLLPYFDLPKHVFEGIQQLLDARNPDARRRVALERLKRYAGLSGAAAPIAELARARLAERVSTPGLHWPYRGKVEQHLRNCDRYIDGIAELFRSGPVQGWEAPHQGLAAQLRDHCAWVKAAILPKARAEPMLPSELYADRLRNVGVDISPEQAIAMGMTAFAEVRDEMARVAADIARSRKLASSDYRQVLRELKRESVPPERVLALYRERLAAIEEIVTRERLVSLPRRAASIRLASEAESAAIPAPYLNAPRLIGNRGERGEFVLPLSNPNARTPGRTDDFTAPGPAWTLTAHEARPGHELQYAAMVERGVSLARAVFAFNSTNVEGWALYAESIMLPHFPPDGQLFGLQLRLARAARAFLDPMVNLGRITPAAAQEFLVREVALSEPMAQQEADRYAFVHPGQAVSYLYGYQRMRELRMKAELALGARFDQRAFHDLVLEQGLLPPRLLEQSVLEELARRYR